MHLHVLGICGTFMGSVALLARAAGYRVTGADTDTYPPMSTLLADRGVPISQGYRPEDLGPPPDRVLVGNALSRGNPAVEHILDHGIPYTSGPQWLGEAVLQHRNVFAVAGTHGKTTTTALLAWILVCAGRDPGYLVGGVAADLDGSARLGRDAGDFVIEADEYDTAFFDKRAKFVHYRPQIAILNNLEFDHADIYADLAAIRWQFHQLVRTVPSTGRLFVNGADSELERVLSMGSWTPVERFGVGESADWSWTARKVSNGGRRFEIWYHDRRLTEVRWLLFGEHNVANGVAAFAAACHAGVAPDAAAVALSRFSGIQRRMEPVGEVNGVQVLDDFAHHPTAIQATLAALRSARSAGRILAAVEPRSNTMRMGVHNATLPAALAAADAAFVYRPPGVEWDCAATNLTVSPSIPELAQALAATAEAGDVVVLMSNGPFDGLRDALLEALKAAGAGGDRGSVS